MSARTVLVTGFEPFGGRRTNTSWAAVQGLVELWDGADTLRVSCLPVTFDGAPRELRRLLDRYRPDVAVCVGEAGRSAVGVERVAVNLVDARIPDNDGERPVDVPVVAGGPAARFSTLPVEECVAAVTRAGIPAEVSESAGTYVCNAVFYHLQQLLDGDQCRSGFVHVPLAPDAAGERGPALVDAARALREVLRAALDPLAAAPGGGPTARGR